MLDFVLKYSAFLIDFAILIMGLFVLFFADKDNIIGLFMIMIASFMIIYDIKYIKNHN